MRLKLFMQPKSPRPVLPFNYQYHLSAAIYKILARASPEYSQFLHDHGYPAPSGRLMKLFTFSKLQIPNGYHTENGLTTRDQRPWLLYVGSPMLAEFVQNFVIGLFEQAEIMLAFPNRRLSFQIVQIEAIAEPVFTEQMNFKTLSPIVVSTMVDAADGRRQIYYYRPEDAGLSSAIEKNLREKWAIIQPQQESATQLNFQPDQDYLARRAADGKKTTKKITIKPDTPAATEIICFELPFRLEGSPELLRTAWECGIGEHTSQGFGMVEAA